ncbi:hypothetical protein CR513_30485, partial [Mucuna pruriens]
MDITEICNQKEHELKDIGRVKLFKPKAAYAFTKSQRVAICKWVKELKLPDGYASNLGRCVDINQGKLHGMKSHDCHVFMQRLIPIAFDSLPKHIWNPLVELSHFFRELTSTTLNVENLTVMEGNIPVLLCKLEQIFPPTFFDSMEHLPIHLPYEARVGGPVQYRWMYPFERFIHSLKNKVKNKTRVEASIYEVFNGGDINDTSFFIYSSYIRLGGKSITYFLDQVDLEAAHLYVLLKCEHVEPYLDLISQLQMLKLTMIFRQHFLHENNIQDSLLINLAWGPKRKVESWTMYIINGFKFHTIVWSEDMNSINHGVYIRGTNGQLESDFYGNLFDIIQLEYIGFPIMKLVLFKCDWFDNTPNIGTKVHNKYEIVEVRTTRDIIKHTIYSYLHNKLNNWLAVIKTKARSRIVNNTLPQIEQEASYQDDEFVGLQVVLHIDLDVVNESLANIDGGGEEIDIQLLDQTKFHEPNKDEYITIRSESENDFNDIDTS